MSVDDPSSGSVARPTSSAQPSFDHTLAALRAAAEPTRLRILAILGRIDLTVGEVCRVLGQAQPRVSRHLKLLVDAGLLERHTEGTSAFFRPLAGARRLPAYEAVLGLIDWNDEAFARDRARLEIVRAGRAQAAADYFERNANEWDRVRELHVSDSDVEHALIEALAGRPIRDLLDVGTGTGRMLELFAGQVRRGVGVDLSREMLNVARTNLDRAGLRHCSVRQGDVYDLDLPAGSMDVAVLHHVLHFLDDPSTAVAESARMLRPNGTLLIVDFAPHDNEDFRTDYAHRFLGFGADEVTRWCEEGGLRDVQVRQLERTDLRPKPDGRTRLTTTIWSATQRSDAPELRAFEAAS